jgi:hypothetical protein
MALGWNTLRSFPRLRTYADAAKREAETKPIKGDDRNLKPIAQRSMKWRHIRKAEDGTISIYDTAHTGFLPVLTFNPDNTVLVRPSAWGNKATGHDMIREILGLNIWTEAGDSWVKCKGGTYRLRPQPKALWDRDKNEWVRPAVKPEHDNRFKWVQNETSSYPYGEWEFLSSSECPVTHVIDRKGARAVRERYADYLRYASAMFKLRRDNPPSFAEYVEAFDMDRSILERYTNYSPWWLLPNNPLRREFDHAGAAEICRLMRSDVPEDQYKALLRLTSRNWGGGYNDLLKAIERCLLMHHHAEMLKVKQHEPGVKAIDRYKWAIPA